MIKHFSLFSFFHPSNFTLQTSVRPWGVWATLCLGLVVFIVFIIIQGLAVVAMDRAAPRLDTGAEDAPAASMSIDGDALAAATCATGVICPALIVLLVAVFKRPILSAYLGLSPVSWKTLAAWTGAGLGMAALFDRITDWAGRPVVPEFMSQAYTTADAMPLFWVALIIAAPLFEEVFFRGFLFTGFAGSRIGGPGAIGLTALLWASIHLQYELFEMTIVLLIGLLLGAARLRTGSLYVPLTMHASVNLMATLQAMMQA